jgi:serine/threonine protein phosphatase PrpC
MEGFVNGGNSMQYASITKKGYLETYPTKPNQDSLTILPRFLGNSENAVFGVFDGHGGNGERVSQFVARNLPRNLESCLQREEDVNLALQNAFKVTADQLLETESTIASFAGSTAVLVYVKENNIYCANCGDSRAVLGKLNADSEIEAFPLSIDHKPERAEESKRILSRNGRIEACKGSKGEPVGPLRVWLKKQNVPGLAMTRAFGDLVASAIGVVPEPEIISHSRDINSQQFLIIASDGIWEFIESQEAVEIVSACTSPQEACEELAHIASTRWIAEEDMIDDITIIVIFL